MLSTGGAAAGAAAAPGQAAQPATVDGSFNPLIGQAAGNASAAAPMAAPAGGGGARRSGRPKQAPAPEMLRPAVPSEAPGIALPCQLQLTWNDPDRLVLAAPESLLTGDQYGTLDIEHLGLEGNLLTPFLAHITHVVHMSDY